MFISAHTLRLGWLVGLGSCLVAPAWSDDVPTQPVSLRYCIETALLNNRALQIERINPEIASLVVDAAYGYYDPILFTQIDRETDTDTGGFDPTDFDRDTTYSAESEVARSGLTGFLPSGMSYTIDGSYAHSSGTRNLMVFDSYKMAGNILVRQPLLKNFWIDQGRMTIRVNKKNLKMSELLLSYVMMDIINQVQQGYFELQFTLEDLEVHRRLLRAKEETLAGIRRQVELGTITVLEERLAISQAAKIEADLIASSNAVTQAQNVLKTLLGYTAVNWAGAAPAPVDRLVTVAVPLDLSDSWQRGIVQRPDYAQLKVNVERADIDLKFRRNQLFPAIDLIAGYGRRGASAIQTIPGFPAEASFRSAWDQIEDADAPRDIVGVVISMPLSRAAERANYKASKQLKAQAALLLKQKEELILREISDALHNAQSSYQRVAATKRAEEYAKAALEAETEKLKGGKSSLYFVLQLQGDLAFAESAAVRARADYSKAVSQLRFAEGSLLDWSRFVIEIE